VVDLSTLNAFSENGFTAVSPKRLRDLAVWCDENSVNSGDARFFIIGSMISSIHDWLEQYDECGGVPASLFQEINNRIMACLSEVLETSDPADASMLACSLREQVRVLLVEPSDWPDF